MSTSNATYPPPPSAGSFNPTSGSTANSASIPAPVPKDPAAINGQAISSTSSSSSSPSPSQAATTAGLASLNLGPVIPTGTTPIPSAPSPPAPSATVNTTQSQIPRSESFTQSVVRRFSSTGKDKRREKQEANEIGRGEKINMASTSGVGSGASIIGNDATPVGGVNEKRLGQGEVQTSESKGIDPSSMISSAPAPAPGAKSPSTSSPRPTSENNNKPSSSPTGPTITTTPATPVFATYPDQGAPSPITTPAPASSSVPVPRTDPTSSQSQQQQKRPINAAPKKKKKQGGLASFFAALGCGSSKHYDEEEQVGGRAAGTTSTPGGRKLEKQQVGQGVGGGGVKPGISAVGNAVKTPLGGVPSNAQQTTQARELPPASVNATSTVSPIRTDASPTSPPTSTGGAGSSSANGSHSGILAGAGAVAAAAAGTAGVLASERSQGQGQQQANDGVDVGRDSGSAGSDAATGVGFGDTSDISVVVPPLLAGETLPLEETEGVTSAAVQPPGSFVHLHPHPHLPSHVQNSSSSNSNSSPSHNAQSQAGDSGTTEISDDSFMTETSSDVDSSGYVNNSSAGQDNQNQEHQQQQQMGAFPLMEEDEIDDEDRLIRQGGVGIPIGPDGKPRPLLPPMSSEHTGRKCLVLDLDETLLHSSFKMIPSADFIVPVEIESTTHNVYVIKRPGVDNFLKRMGEIYEVVVFTASLSKYADPVLDILDIHRVVKHRLFRESCYNHKGNYVKDLSQLGREMNTTIIIDNSPASYIFHPNNAVPVSTWFNDPHDTELTDLCPFLSDLEQVDDIRGVLDGSW